MRIYGMAKNEAALARFARTHSTRFTPSQRETLKKKLLSFRSASVGVPSSAPVAKASGNLATERSEPTRARPVAKPTSAPKAREGPSQKGGKTKDAPSSKGGGKKGPRPNRATISDIRQFRWMSSEDKNRKLLELARSARRKPHPGEKDTTDVTKWTIAPGSRTFTGHTERFRVDHEYRQLLQECGVVDKDGKLARWTYDDQGNYIFKDFEDIVAQEAERGWSTGGKGRGAPSAPSSSSSQSWSSSSRNWQGSSRW